jgi:5,10-methylenetetrahydromethanopterin reductase
VALRFSLQMLPEQPLDELIDAVVLADELGYHACYSADEIYHKDMWLLFAAAARQTKRVRLGPCVSPIYLRDPTYVAQLAATLDELSGGRTEVVFGIGNLAMLGQYGVAWKGTRPIARLREAHAVMRALLDHGEIDFAGDFYRYSGVFTAARPVQQHLPLKIGAMGGPKSMQLAGEIADGMLTACAYSPQAISYAREQVCVGARRADRDEGTLDVGDNLLGAISTNGDAARAAARVLAAFYIPSMPATLLERRGLFRDELAAVIDAFAAGEVERALELTPEAAVDMLSIAGTPQDWIARLSRDVLPTGIEHLLLSFADPFTVRSWSGREVNDVPDLAGQLRLFREQVIPALH